MTAYPEAIFQKGNLLVADDPIGMLHNDKVHSFDQRLNQRTRSFN
jgi:hypothetical protein